MLVIASLRGHSNDLSLPGLNLACSCLRKVWGLQSGCLPFLQLGAGGADLCSVRSGTSSPVSHSQHKLLIPQAAPEAPLLGGGRGKAIQAWNAAPLLCFPEVELMKEASFPVLCL